ncbi:MAG: nuclear transport factor 2 family protein, partial [Acidimicrobiia bacterium]
MQSVYELAERWSRLWEEDPARMVEEVYASNVVVSHAGRGDRGKVHGRRELHRAERELHELIPDHRNEIIRVVDGGDGTAVVESLITGTGPGDDGLQSCPACVWWRLDGEARVTEEIALYEWGKRRPHDGTAGGTVVSGDGRSRSG